MRVISVALKDREIARIEEEYFEYSEERAYLSRFFYVEEWVKIILSVGSRPI